MLQSLIDKFSYKIPNEIKALAYVYTNNYMECEKILQSENININHVFRLPREIHNRYISVTELLSIKNEPSKNCNVKKLLKKHTLLKFALEKDGDVLVMPANSKINCSTISFNLLVVATEQKNTDMIKLLIKHGAFVFSPSQQYEYLDSISIALTQKEYDILKILAESIPENYFVNLQDDASLIRNISMIFFDAITQHPIHILELLLKNLIEIGKYNTRALSVFQVFNFESNYDIMFKKIKLFLKYGASANNKEQNLLLRALEFKDFELVVN
jgi:hypothetical protein